MDITLTTQVLPSSTGQASSARTPAAARDGSRLPAGGKSSPPTATSVSLDSAVAQINTYLGNSQRELNFSIDRASGRTVIKVVNPNSGEVIRQIPSEEVLKMAAALARYSFHTFDALA